MPKRKSVGLLCGLRRMDGALAVDQRLLCFDHKRHTRLRQVNIALGAIEKPDSNLILEIANLLAQRGLGDVKLFCRSAEMKFFCNCDNIAQQSELNTRIHRPTLQGPVFEWVCRTTYRDPHFHQDEMCSLDSAAWSRR